MRKQQRAEEKRRDGDGVRWSQEQID